MTGPSDPFGRTAIPVEHWSRDERVALCAAAAQDMVSGCPLGPIAGRYLGHAILAWLDGGGDLVRDHLRIAPEQGNKLTPQKLYSKLVSREASDAVES